MLFGSVCSGIEAASVAWEPLGWRCAYVAEINPFPAAVLAHRFGAGRPENMPDPDEPGLGEKDARERRAALKALDRVEWGKRIRNFGDFTKVDPHAHPIELLVGGTPCQAFSFAGLRKSLADERGNLTLQFVRLVHATESLRWAIWENVPGVLSTEDNAFGCFLGGLVGSDAPLSTPYGERWPDSGMVAGPLGRAAWRVLDAQHFGLAQRRRRVFVIFCPAAAGGDPAAVLFERKGVCGDFEARGSARPGVSGGVGAGAQGDGNEGGVKLAHTLRAEGFDASEDGTGRGTPIVPVFWCREAAGTLTTSYGRQPDNTDSEVGPNLVAIPILEAGARTGLSTTDPRAGIGVGNDGDPMFTLQASKQHAVAFAGQSGLSDVHPCLRAQAQASHRLDTMGVALAPEGVRRLMPVECERLQGFPDGHTLIPWNGKDAPDGLRYFTLGNSMAVPVMNWLGSRIQAAEDGTLATHEWRPPPQVARFLNGGG